MAFSQKHYRLVSPPSDTTAQVQDRAQWKEAAAKGIADRERAYPILTAENGAEAIKFQEARIRYHYQNPANCPPPPGSPPAKFPPPRGQNPKRGRIGT